MFHYISYDNIKQDVATTDAHSKRIIKLFQNRTVFFYDVITIWEHTDGCVKQYRCATKLYLLSMLVNTYNIIIDCGVVAIVYGIEVVDGFNAT